MLMFCFFIRFSIFLRCFFFFFYLNNIACLVQTPSQYAQSLLMAPSVFVLTEFDCPVRKCVSNLVEAMERLVHYKSPVLS